MFKFKLESVLKLRKIREKEIIKEFQIKKGEVLAAEKELERFKENLNKAKIEKSLKLTINDLKLLDNYIFKLKESIKYQAIKINNLNMELKQIELRLFQAQKERKVLENLKEKKYQEYLKEENLKEQKFLDEIASISFNKKKNST